MMQVTYLGLRMKIRFSQRRNLGTMPIGGRGVSSRSAHSQVALLMLDAFRLRGYLARALRTIPQSARTKPTHKRRRSQVTANKRCKAKANDRGTVSLSQVIQRRKYEEF